MWVIEREDDHTNVFILQLSDIKYMEVLTI